MKSDDQSDDMSQANSDLIEKRKKQEAAILADPDISDGLRQILTNMIAHGFPLTLQGYAEWNWGLGFRAERIVGEMWDDVPDMFHEEEA